MGRLQLGRRSKKNHRMCVLKKIAAGAEWRSYVRKEKLSNKMRRK
jgi:hypothetical protein